jgi:hypothetical protein
VLPSLTADSSGVRRIRATGGFIASVFFLAWLISKLA